MFIGKNVKLSHYHEGDGNDFANWQWDENFINPLSDDVIHPFTAEDWEKIFRNSSRSDENVEFTVRKVASDNLIGFVSLSNINIRNHSCELGIGFPKEEDRSKGYGVRPRNTVLDIGLWFQQSEHAQNKIVGLPFQHRSCKGLY